MIPTSTPALRATRAASLGLDLVEEAELGGGESAFDALFMLEVALLVLEFARFAMKPLLHVVGERG